jgi:hypothetical protein
MVTFVFRYLGGIEKDILQVEQSLRTSLKGEQPSSRQELILNYIYGRNSLEKGMDKGYI